MTVEVPAGVASGTRLRISGRGQSGGRYGPPGDLYVEVMVTPDPRFERHEADLVHRVGRHRRSDARNQTHHPVDRRWRERTRDPCGTQPGTVFRMTGLGVTHLGRRTGRPHVVVFVTVPNDLTRTRRKLSGDGLSCEERGLIGPRRPADPFVQWATSHIF